MEPIPTLAYKVKIEQLLNKIKKIGSQPYKKEWIQKQIDRYFESSNQLIKPIKVIETMQNFIEKSYFEKWEKLKEKSIYYDQSLRFKGPFYLESEFEAQLEDQTQHQNEIKMISRPLSLYDFIQRIKTFQLRTWHLKPDGFEASNCAKYGWINNSKNTLKCTFCEVEFQVLKEDSTILECDEKSPIPKPLILKHKQDCLWRKSPCDDKIYAVPPQTSYSILNGLKTYLEIMEPYSSYYEIEYEDGLEVEIFSKLIEELKKECESSQLIRNPNLLKLYLYGWYPSPSSFNQKDSFTSLECWLCSRKVGSWNFKSTGQQSKDSESKKPNFNLMSQHRNFCPILQKDIHKRIIPVQWFHLLLHHFNISTQFITPFTLDPKYQIELELSDGTLRRKSYRKLQRWFRSLVQPQPIVLPSISHYKRKNPFETKITVEQALAENEQRKKKLRQKFEQVLLPLKDELGLNDEPLSG